MSTLQVEDDVSHTDHVPQSNLAYLFYDAEQCSFEEVAGTCPNKDDYEMRCLTIRSITIGLIFIIGMSILHMWIYSSPAAVLLHPTLVILTSHIFGKLWSLIPWKKINHGPWTIKEHTLVLIMGNIAWMFFEVYSFATISYLQWREQQPDYEFIYSFFIIIAVQFLGFGLAGILRRFLVWSSGQVWPTNFPSIALLRTLHENQAAVREQLYGNYTKQNIWKRLFSNRLAFFSTILIIQFIYCWFPQYIMPVLGSFSWMCMIKPSNYLLSQLTGHNGLGMGSISFNWFNLTWLLGSPLIVPRWAIVNITVGFVLVTWIITPIIYFTNVWDTYDRPIAEVTRSTTIWSALGLVSSAAAFANLSAALVHMFLHHSKSLWKELVTRSLKDKGNDVHCRLIALYPDVPDWWFAVVSVLAFIVLIVTGQISSILVYYEVFFAVVLSIIYILPFAMVASITGQTIQNPSIVYLLGAIATSLWVYDKSVMLAFITVSYSMFCQTLQLVSDMKLSHYMKIAPRILFLVQLVACLVSSSLSIGMQFYFFRKDGFDIGSNTPNATGSFGSTSIGEAILNQKKFFDSENQKNRNLLWALLIGAILPVPFWLGKHRWEFCRFVHIPLILSFISWMPIVPAGTLFTWLLIGILTAHFFKKLSWKRHIYLTSSALDAGFFLCMLIVYGPLAQYGIHFPSWWGVGGTNKDGCPMSLLNTSAFRVTFQN